MNNHNFWKLFGKVSEVLAYIVSIRLRKNQFESFSSAVSLPRLSPVMAVGQLPVTRPKKNNNNNNKRGKLFHSAGKELAEYFRTNHIIQMILELGVPNIENH